MGWGQMQFGCVPFVAAIVGIACAVVAALAFLFWHPRMPRGLEDHEKRLLTNWKRMKRAKTART
jgi:hypothetical protein